MFRKCKKSNKSGFTLIELIVTIAIVTILSLILLVTISSYVKEAEYVTDTMNLRTLNNITSYYRITLNEFDPFNDELNSSEDLMNILVEEDLLLSPLSTQTNETVFLWSFDSQTWHFIENESFYTIIEGDGVTVNNTGRLQGSYMGSEKDVLLLNELSGKKIKEIYQDVFKNSGLTSFVFGTPSEVTRIHARAFYNNELSSIVFPETLKRIDLWAFKDNNLTEIVLPDGLNTVEQNAFQGNNITKITIGSQVTSIGTSAFGNNHASFLSAYQSGGAGTYSFTNGVWIKQ